MHKTSRICKKDAFFGKFREREIIRVAKNFKYSTKISTALNDIGLLNYSNLSVVLRPTVALSFKKIWRILKILESFI